MTATESVKANWRAYAAAIPVVFVNTTAFIGQFAFLQAHVRWIIPGIVLIAVSIESVGIYYAFHAHLAMLANDSAMRLKLAAYSFAAVIGVMNYSHYAAPHWRPTALAVIMLIASSISPWLWGVHSRRASRDKLMARKLVDEHAVRLGANRWTWHPARSIRVTRWSAWHGVNDPARAIAHFADRYGTADTDPGALDRAALRVPAAVPASEPEALPLGAAVAHAIESVPVAAAAISPVAQAVLGAGGTLANGPAAVVPEPAAQVLSADAHLEAEASLSGGKPTAETIASVELWLMGVGLDDLPSVRAVARKLGDQNQRRLARKLLDARVAAGTSFVSAPPSGQINASGSRTQVSDQGNGLIASPLAYRPGGVNGGDN